ncbi:Protein CBG25544 [Caenorhabditis briggsae]|uniref:Protein CBG25544 n=1 Tax=Caenorhabditis briggsae TaxID=6238 RepID=B6IIR6_CAEBR|nr:Protein CBG25544 [Caenorhabditis briggsae]CAR99796.1 Protein CBG25544 [Caenorhabditis briggsae]
MDKVKRDRRKTLSISNIRFSSRIMMSSWPNRSGWFRRFRSSKEKESFENEKNDIEKNQSDIFALR